MFELFTEIIKLEEFCITKFLSLISKLQKRNNSKQQLDEAFIIIERWDEDMLIMLV